MLWLVKTTGDKSYIRQWKSDIGLLFLLVEHFTNSSAIGSLCFPSLAIFIFCFFMMKLDGRWFWGLVIFRLVSDLFPWFLLQLSDVCFLLMIFQDLVENLKYGLNSGEWIFQWTNLGKLIECELSVASSLWRTVWKPKFTNVWNYVQDLVENSNLVWTPNSGGMNLPTLETDWMWASDDFFEFEEP